jgi:hypothetical protein
MAAELFPVEKQTVMTKLIVAFRNFEKAPKIRSIFNVFADMGAYKVTLNIRFLYAYLQQLRNA